MAQIDKLYSEFTDLIERGGMTERRLQRVIHTVANRQRGLMVIMEDVHNPHNLAAIARSCDAFGVQDVAFTMENEDLFDPKGVGKIVSASAAKWLDYRVFDTGTHHALTTLKSEGYHIAATWVNPDARDLYAVDFTQYDKLALMVGNEHAGISPAAIELADSAIYIPMRGIIESFNVSVAAAITLAEIVRQRNASETDFLQDDATALDLAHDLVIRAMKPNRPKNDNDEALSEDVPH